MSTASHETAATVAAVILAGGAASRLGGTDKTRLPIAGASVLERVLRAAPVGRRIVVGPSGADGADLAIGSRYIDGGEVKNWPRSRYLLSKLGNEYIAVALGDDTKDMTAGYRAFRREVLEDIDLDALSNKGYIFQVEIAHKVADAGFDVVEVPITFEDRKLGESKLDASFAAASFAEVTKWGVQDKASFVGNLASETWRQFAHAVSNSKAANLPSRAAEAPKQVADLAGEIGSLTKYELGNLNLGKVAGRASDGLETAKNLTTETVRQALHVLKSGSK